MDRRELLTGGAAALASLALSQAAAAVGGVQQNFQTADFFNRSP